MSDISVADLRVNYTRAGLNEADLPSDPLDLFQTWLAEAIAAELTEPNGMTLATTDQRGYPCARIVLLKGVDSRGFVFYTNYNSDKSQQLLHNPQAALVFWWAELERQVRVEGRVTKVSPQESDAYFQSRPRGSQVGAWVSNQSQVISDRQVLTTRLADLTEKYANQSIPRPNHWGGWRVVPDVIEFWQGRPNRLHDRLRYRLVSSDNWRRERLSP